MKKLLLILLICGISILTGCTALREQMEAQQRYISEIEYNYQRSAIKGEYLCESNDDCVKKFRLTSSFISNNSNMKIQFANDGVIETYSPTQFNYIAMKATREPVASKLERIRLVIYCNVPTQAVGIYLDMYLSCIRNATDKYSDFEKYIRK